MTRSIVIFALILALLLAANNLLVKKDAEINRRYTNLYSLVDRDKVSKDEVRALGIVFPGSKLELRYMKVDDAWRMPQYRGAYARGDLVDSIVRDITDTWGIKIDTRDRPASDFGFSSESIMIKIYATATEPIGGIVCGRVVPGFQSTDSYVKIIGENAIYQINGNPLGKLGSPGGLPPLVDSQIIPDSLGAKGELGKIFFEPHSDSSEMLWIERREKPESEMKESPMRRMMPDYKEYDWFAILPDGTDVKLNERSAVEYTGFVRRLSFDRLPRISELDEHALRPSEKKLVLEFEPREKPKPPPVKGVDPTGTASQVEKDVSSMPFKESIEIRESDRNANSYIYYTGTNLIASVDQKKIKLFFPSLHTLESAPKKPSIYSSVPPAPPGGAPALFSPR